MSVVPGINTDQGGGALSIIAANTLLGNNTGSAALPTALTPAQVSTLLNLAGTYLALTGGTLTGALTVSGTVRLNTIGGSGTWVQIRSTFNVTNPDILFENSANGIIARMRNDGNFAIGATSPAGRFHVQGINAATVQNIVQGALSQSAPLQEWRNSVGTVLAAIGPTGQLTAPIGTTPDLMIGTGASGILETKTPVQARSAIGVNTGMLQLDMTGDGAVLPVSILNGRLRVPYNCTINSWEMVSEEPGSLVVAVLKDSLTNWPPNSADAITGTTNRPTITASQRNDSSTLTGWAPALNEGDYLKIEVISVASVIDATLVLRVTRT